MSDGEDGGDEALVTSLVVPGTEPGTRLDVFLARALAQHSRSRLKALIDLDRVTVDGKTARGSLKLRGGERLIVIEPPPVSVELVAEDIPPEALRADDAKASIPPLYGALLKNEQDVHLFEQLVFLNRRAGRPG